MNSKLKTLELKSSDATLLGDLYLAEGNRLVIFAHGSGSSRLSERNRFVAKFLQNRGIGAFLFDLLTEEEDEIYENRFNIDLITSRLIQATLWLKNKLNNPNIKYGYFGASTGAAAALRAAAKLKEDIRAVVSRGGRTDMTGPELLNVETPTLFVVGERDPDVLRLNTESFTILKSEKKKLQIIPRATHLFEEPGTLEQVAEEAADWFVKYLK